MTPIEFEFIDHLENFFDINEHIDIVEEKTQFNLEIPDDANGNSAVIEIVVTCNLGTEQGGEPDEELLTYQNKTLIIKEFDYFDMEGDNLRVTQKFNDRVENVLNEQIYD